METRRATARTGKLLGQLAAIVLGVSLAPAALAAGGSIRGQVTATPQKYLAETVVYIKQAPGSFTPKKLAMDQKGMAFIPHVLAVTVGDTVSFLNHDKVTHNVYSPDNETYNLGAFKPGEERDYTFKNAGAYTQLCSIHPEMLGYIFVGQNPFAATVDRTGRYEIKDVPPGTYQLAVWSSNLKAAEKSVTVTADQAIEADWALTR